MPEKNQNFNLKDTEEFLKTAIKVLTLGSIERDIGLQTYSDIPVKQSHLAWDIESMKVILQKLAHAEKPTRGPSCSSEVTEEKIIAREKLRRANTGTVGSSSDEEKGGCINEYRIVDKFETWKTENFGNETIIDGLSYLESTDLNNNLQSR